MNISVVMATYNGAKYINKQLESIRTQSYTPDEVIIFDDNSEDSTCFLIESFISRYKLSNWKLHKNTKNVGYKKNFYLALKEAKGDIVFLSDQDDEWIENKIDTIINVFLLNTGALAVNTAVSLIDDNSETLFEQKQENYVNSNFLYTKNVIQKITNFDELYISKHNITPGCAMAIKKDLLKDFFCLYDFGMPHDWFLNLLAAYNKGCFFYNKELTRYRIHNQNAIGSNTGFKKGILTKDRSFRIEDYNNRINAINRINRKYSVNKNMSIVELYEKMIQFYEHPNVIRLIRLYRTQGYKELAKRKVKVWEVFISLNLDILIRNIVKRFI